MLDGYFFGKMLLSIKEKHLENALNQEYILTFIIYNKKYCRANDFMG